MVYIFKMIRKQQSLFLDATGSLVRNSDEFNSFVIIKHPAKGKMGIPQCRSTLTNNFRLFPLYMQKKVNISEHNEKWDGLLNEKWDGLLYCDPLDLATCSKENYCNFATLNLVVDTKTSIIQRGPNISNCG